jgi:putative hydrolase of the HAD superfamily
MDTGSAATVVSQKKAVIFDLFHTLTALELTQIKGPGTSEILGISRAAWNEQLLEKSRPRLAGEEKDPYVIIRRMAHAIDPDIPDELIRRATQSRIERFAAALANIPANTKEVLQRLKEAQKKIGLLSNADVAEIYAWPQCPVRHLFDSAIFSCEVGFVKPEKAIYEASLKDLNVRAEEAVFVGDGGSHELEGAKAAGITAVMIAGIIRGIWPEKVEEREAGADYCIETLDELLVKN